MDPAYDRAVDAVRFLRTTGDLPEDGTNVSVVWTTVAWAAQVDGPPASEQTKDSTTCAPAQ
ncbi:MAG: hypothetical protein HZC26_03690 [Candidatus Magasanikbacteria bacterium]|nr:hypothetical protein [Candidatus Magasanikbacteria bacterium]